MRGAGERKGTSLALNFVFLNTLLWIPLSPCAIAEPFPTTHPRMCVPEERVCPPRTHPSVGAAAGDAILAGAGSFAPRPRGNTPWLCLAGPSAAGREEGRWVDPKTGPTISPHSEVCFPAPPRCLLPAGPLNPLKGLEMERGGEEEGELLKQEQQRFRGSFTSGKSVFGRRRRGADEGERDWPPRFVALAAAEPESCGQGRAGLFELAPVLSDSLAPS